MTSAMAEELIGHVVAGFRVRQGKPEHRYKFVACECSTTASCVLSKKEEPALRELVCAYDAFYENPLVRVIVEVEENKIVRVVKVKAKDNCGAMGDLRPLLIATALAKKKNKQDVLKEFRGFSDSITRAGILKKFKEKHFSEFQHQSVLYKVFKTMCSGFTKSCTPQDSVNACLLFGREKALDLCGETLAGHVREAVHSVVKASFRDHLPVLHPELVGGFFEIAEVQMAEARAAAVIRRETAKILAVPRLHLDSLRVSETDLAGLFDHELIGENAQGIYRAGDESLMEVLKSCVEHHGECNAYTQQPLRMDPKNKNKRWCANPYTLYQYVVKEVHVFFDHEEICVEWDGEKYPLRDGKGMTTHDIYDTLFCKTSTARFSDLGEVHIYGGGVPERKVTEQAKVALRKWNAREVHIWESNISDAKKNTWTSFESCCGRPDLDSPATVKCCAHIEPAPICLGKHNFAKAFQDFFASESWCVTAEMELGRITKAKNQTMAEVRWDQKGISTLRRAVESHKDALPLLSLPLLHSYTLPDNFFKYKRPVWVSREPISPFVWREHRRLFHNE